MSTKPIYKQYLALFAVGVLSAFAVGGSISVQAQTESQPTSAPKFTEFKPGQTKISGNGNPFKPESLRQTEKPTGGTRGIPDGIDDRVPMLSRDYPWSTIGRVEGTTTDAKQYHCTGTLIADDIVLTNAHCVIDPETHQLSQKILFKPNVVNGAVSNRRDVAQAVQVIYGTNFTGNDYSNQVNDWAVMKIDKPLGRKYGYLGWKSLSPQTLINNKEKLFFVGYSGDFPNPTKKGYEYLTAGPGYTAGFQAGCSIVKEEDNVLFHDCDTAGGSSGGPLIGVIDGQPYIVALNNAEIKNRRTNQDIINLAVKISFLDELAGNR
ncbi:MULTISPECIES: trypsin-like serine peptidase [Calothrix]|uniref:Trypsin-like peptidase domain-containing protein n=2 Tax=Calothrix TaxID=1186 RepID=A0ABR8A570_9CYAN|nr:MULTISPECIES: trypsin-like serine protease [Calothrix]MBD2195110.1 trypsin-like peptidase domain-containing protein [Calothrix parietina FACHB-288]MBD2223708.1 trypsin-like peptidase domain-containing protein [Calothrix anomala FACHB-343]